MSTAKERSEAAAALWEEITVAFESIQADMLKALRGNHSASVRSRRGTRHLGKQLKEFTHQSIQLSKAWKEEKAAARAAKKATAGS